MAYIFEANKVFISYCGVNIYNVYRNDFEEAGTRTCHFTTSELGCEGDEATFDIRDQPGYDPAKGTAANLVQMIVEGAFGVPPEEAGAHIDAEASFEGCCPVCRSNDLVYEAREEQDQSVEYPFTCKNCGITGKELARLEFDGYDID